MIIELKNGEYVVHKTAAERRTERWRELTSVRPQRGGSAYGCGSSGGPVPGQPGRKRG